MEDLTYVFLDETPRKISQIKKKCNSAVHVDETPPKSADSEKECSTAAFVDTTPVKGFLYDDHFLSSQNEEQCDVIWQEATPLTHSKWPCGVAMGGGWPWVEGVHGWRVVMSGG